MIPAMLSIFAIPMSTPSTTPYPVACGSKLIAHSKPLICVTVYDVPSAPSSITSGSAKGACAVIPSQTNDGSILDSATLKVTSVGLVLAINGSGVTSVGDVMRVILTITGSAKTDVVTNQLIVLTARVLPHSSVI